MKTYKNLLPKMFFDKLSNIVNDKWIPWYFLDRTIKSKTNKERIDNFMFTHLLAEAEPIQKPLEIKSNQFTVFEPIIYFINEHVKVNKILRMKLNLYPKQNSVLDHVAHNDFEEKNIGIKTSVFNFTTCNGGTTINNKFYKSKQNELHVFNNECLHYGRVQSNAKTRIVLNINWI